MNSGSPPWNSAENNCARRSGRSAKVKTASRSSGKRAVITGLRVPQLSLARTAAILAESTAGCVILARSTCSSMPTRLSRVDQPRFNASVSSSSARFASRIGTPTSLPSPTALRAGGRPPAFHPPVSSPGPRFAEPHRPPALLAEPDRQRHVLVQQAQCEIGGIVGAGEEFAEPVEGARPAGRALAYRLPQIERLDPGLDAHREDFGERHVHDRAGAVMNQLGDRAGADRPDVFRLVAHRVEHALVAIELLLVAADPDRHLAAGRAARAAADRRVEHIEVLLGEGGADLAHHR